MPKSVEARIAALEKKRTEFETPRIHTFLQVLLVSRDPRCGGPDEEAAWEAVGPPQERVEPGKPTWMDLLAMTVQRRLAGAPA